MKTCNEWNEEHTRICANDPAVHGQLLPNPQMIKFIAEVQQDAILFASQQVEKLGAHFLTNRNVGDVAMYDQGIGCDRASKMLKEIARISNLTLNPQVPINLRDLDDPSGPGNPPPRLRGSFFAPDLRLGAALNFPVDNGGYDSARD
jgi:hypothetical protein